MVANVSQKPSCPVCQRADQVMTLATAYESGISRFAPPPMPVGRVPMIKYMVIGMGIVTVGSFFIIVLLGSVGLPEVVRIIQVVITLIGIVVALVLSILAFLRVGRADLNSQQLLPSWDRALENWSRLRYCKRDNIVFDPQQTSPKALSDGELSSLLAVEVEHKEPAHISSPMATQR
jgi:hypothetical protein